MNPENQIIYEGGVQLIRAGYKVVLLRGKANAFKFPKAMNAVELRCHLIRKSFNIGILLGEQLDGTRVMAVDIDSEEGFETADEYGLVGSMIDETSRGIHILMATDLAATNVLKHRGIDFLFNGHIVAAPSWNADTEHRYTWRNGIKKPSELEAFPSSLYERIQRTPKVSIGGIVTQTRKIIRQISNPRAYCLRIESHQGSLGANGLVRAVSVLRDAGWPPMQTLEFLVSEWNHPPRVTPPWSQGELERAVERVYRM